ncbi:MAG: DUF445 family protein [Bacteroidia bacterium]
MFDQFRTYLARHYPFETLLEPKRDSDKGLAFNAYRGSAAMRAFMAVLKVSPWICGAGFVWAFSIILAERLTPDGAASLWGSIDRFYHAHSSLLQAVNIIAISGLIGYGTNYLAIRMLFRPVERRPIWGQGLIPAQRDRIIYTLANGMHKHILNQDLIRRRVEETGLVRKVNDLIMDGTSGLVRDAELRETVKQTIQTSLEQFAGREDVRKDIRDIIDLRLEENMGGGVKKLLLQTYKRYNKEEYDGAIDKIVQDIPRLVLEVMSKLEKDLDALADFILEQKAHSSEQIMKVFVDLLDRIDITTLLAKQMEHFDEAKLERMVWEATNEQLLYIQYLGTVLGILGGLLIWRPEITGPVYVLGLGLLYVLDKLLYRLRPAGQRKPS